MKKVKVRTFQIIQSATDGDRASKAFDFFIILLILINVILVIADTFSIPDTIRNVFYYVDIFSIVIFTAEYFLRVWTSDLLYPELGPVRSRLRYMVTFMAIVDLLAILPFYIPFVVPVDLRVLRILRVVRLFRLFKMGRYTDALSTIGKVLKDKASQLLSSIFIVFLLMVISSVLMYNVENPAQPEVFKNAFSGLWWAVATFTTVGYGDIYPVTAAGKILSAVIAVLGIGLVAVPTGIISAGFMERADQEDDQFEYCPHCGHKL